jgi:glycosyltransferase involved in cell wall biosynthesis
VSTASRVVFVAPFGLGQKTTVWARTLPLARELAALGHLTHILIPPWDTPEDAGRTWDDAGVRLENVTLRGGIPATVGRMLGRIADLKPDIVHIVKPRAHAGLVQWRLWQKRRRPLLMLDIDDWEQAWAPINGYNPALARFLAWQEEWGIRHADGITAASRWLEARAQHYASATPVRYLPNGVDLPERPPVFQPSLGPATILFFSRYVEVEPAWLAAFWEALHQQLPESRLLVAGQPLQEGRDVLYAATMAEAAPHGAAAVEWRGAVSPQAVPALYDAARVAIFPAAPVPLQEAKCSVRLATTLLHGVPVVASAIGEQANYGADGAARLVAADASPEAFAAVVVQMLQDPSAQADAILHAYTHLQKNYQWADLGRRLSTFYDALAATRL